MAIVIFNQVKCRFINDFIQYSVIGSFFLFALPFFCHSAPVPLPLQPQKRPFKKNINLQLW